jgi:hypothetical protein
MDADDLSHADIKAGTTHNTDVTSVPIMDILFVDPQTTIVSDQTVSKRQSS